MATIGTAHEYEAVIVDSATQVPLRSLPWSSVNWQRTRNSVSQAGVSVPYGAIGFGSVLDGLSGWEQMLRIERNGAVVWDGPITGWKTDRDGNLTIRALDRFAFSYKRLVGAYQFFEDQSVTTVIGQLITDSDMANTATAPYEMLFFGGTPSVELITREYLVEQLARVYDSISEICDATSTGFFTCTTLYTYYSELLVRSLMGDAPILSEESVLGRPSVDVDCLGQATYTYVGAAGQGRAGFPILVSNAVYYGNFLGSLLERGSVDTQGGKVDDVARVAARNAAQSAGPALTLEQMQLSPNFGSEDMAADLANLFPGVVFRLNFEDSAAFRIPFANYSETGGVGSYFDLDEIVEVRMDQLDATVSKADSGISETLSVSCRPINTAAN